MVNDNGANMVKAIKLTQEKELEKQGDEGETEQNEDAEDEEDEEF